MLSVHVATEEQIEKIIEKHLKRVYHCSYSHDDEDGIGFIWCSSSLLGIDHTTAVLSGLPILQWQVRGKSPMFFSLQKGGKRYDVYYPEGELLKRLKEITTKTIDAFSKGAEI